MAVVHPCAPMTFSGLASNRSRAQAPIAWLVNRLPTDPIGNTTVTFTGVNANSEIRVYRADGVELAGVENCSANHALTWGVYAPGSNSVNRIVIVHPNYRIKEFTYTPAVGTTSLPVQQEADKWYSNPA